MPDLPKKVNLPRRNRKVYRPQYGTTHRKLRELVLDKNPICTHCRNAFAEHAHHLVLDATRVEHYQALCPACHHEMHRGDD